MFDTIIHIFPYAIALATPLLVTSLGGLFSERGGVVNIGLEGLMVVGGFASAVFTVYLTPTLGPLAIWLSLLVAMLFGALFSVLHAFASINLNANQVISGTAINMIAGAVTVFLARSLTGSGNIQLTQGIPRFDVPGLVEVPVIGRLFFYQTYGTTWLIFAILALSTFLLYKTAFGLRLRACGENPHAADAAGINVYRVRYGAVMISGALSGLGGATILVTYSGEFSGSVAGMGFLALAALIFGQWKPTGVLGATFFFGFAATLANASQAEPALQAIPEVVLKVFPYVVTLVALVLFSKSTQAPRAAGEPFEKGKR